MFGHQNDIITQDQKKDASVTLPESAFEALAVPPPASGSATDSPVVQPNEPDNQTATAPTAPALSPTSIDGFSAPNARLSSPFAYMQSNVSDFSKPSGSNDGAQTDSAQVPDPIQLGTVSDDTTAPQGPATEEEQAPVVDEPTSIPFPEEQQPEPLLLPAVPPEIEAPLTVPEDLERIRAEALNELSPLVSQLELSPEEKFHTVMSLIHSTDNHALIGDAYEAAKAIHDPKARAEALLAVINEIDYFSHQGEQPAA